MNGIEKITARLISDAQAEIDALNAETDAQCAAIAQEYAAKAKAEYDRLMTEGARSCRTQAERLGSAADMEAKKAILAFKQEMVGKAFSDAIQKMIDMPEEDYVAFLASLAASAAANGDEELVFSAKDAASVGRKVADKANAILKGRGVHGGLTVAQETRDIPGGVIVKQGNIEVNCAVDTLVQMSRGRLSAQVAEILFA